MCKNFIFLAQKLSAIILNSPVMKNDFIEKNTFLTLWDL